MEKTKVDSYRGFAIYENERYDSQAFNEMLDDCYPTIQIGDCTFYPSDILKNCDPVAYDVMEADHQDRCYTVESPDGYIGFDDSDEYDTQDKAKEAIDEYLEDLDD